MNNTQQSLLKQQALFIACQRLLSIIRYITFRLDAEMNTSIQLLNAVKAKTGATSDYALAQKLNTSQQVMSNYMTKGRAISDDIAVKAASILEIDESIVLASIHVERAKTDVEKRAWTVILERLGGVAAALVLGIGVTTSPAPVKAAEGATSYNIQQSNVYYVKSRRRKRTFNPIEFMVNQLLSIA